MISNFSPEYMIPLVKGAGFTIFLCFLATVIGLIIGTLVGQGMLAKNKYIRLASAAYVKLIRGIPLLMLIFLIYFALPLINPNLSTSAFSSALISLSIYAGAYIAELIRGSILSVSKGQFEAADALGFNYFEKMRFVVLPQSKQFLIPPLIGFIIMLVKDSSLVSIIGFIDLARAGRIISNLTFNPLLVFTIVAAIYFVICYSLSKIASYYEAKFEKKVI